MTLVKGKLSDGFGVPLKRITIVLKAISTSKEVIKSSLVNHVSEDGSYEFNLLPGQYSVFLEPLSDYSIGNISIYGDTPESTLNDLLNYPDMEEMPQVVSDIYQIMVRARTAADESIQAATESKSAAWSASLSDQSSSNNLTQSLEGANRAEAAATRAEELIANMPSAGIKDVPDDNISYVRNSGKWVPLEEVTSLRIEATHTVLLVGDYDLILNKEFLSQYKVGDAIRLVPSPVNNITVYLPVNEMDWGSEEPSLVNKNMAFRLVDGQSIWVVIDSMEFDSDAWGMATYRLVLGNDAIYTGFNNVTGNYTYSQDNPPSLTEFTRVEGSYTGFNLYLDVNTAKLSGNMVIPLSKDKIVEILNKGQSLFENETKATNTPAVMVITKGNNGGVVLSTNTAVNDLPSNLSGSSSYDLSTDWSILVNNLLNSKYSVLYYGGYNSSDPVNSSDNQPWGIDFKLINNSTCSVATVDEVLEEIEKSTITVSGKKAMVLTSSKTSISFKTRLLAHSVITNKSYSYETLYPLAGLNYVTNPTNPMSANKVNTSRVNGFSNFSAADMQVHFPNGSDYITPTEYYNPAQVTKSLRERTNIKFTVGGNYGVSQARALNGHPFKSSTYDNYFLVNLSADGYNFLYHDDPIIHVEVGYKDGSNVWPLVTGEVVSVNYEIDDHVSKLSGTLESETLPSFDKYTIISKVTVSGEGDLHTINNGNILIAEYQLIDITTGEVQPTTSYSLSQYSYVGIEDVGVDKQDYKYVTRTKVTSTEAIRFGARVTFSGKYADAIHNFKQNPEKTEAEIIPLEVIHIRTKSGVPTTLPLRPVNSTHGEVTITLPTVDGAVLSENGIFSVLGTFTKSANVSIGMSNSVSNIRQEYRIEVL